jgi:uncharacterized protein (UPF0305 family)
MAAVRATKSTRDEKQRVQERHKSKKKSKKEEQKRRAKKKSKKEEQKRRAKKKSAILQFVFVRFRPFHPFFLPSQ